MNAAERMRWLDLVAITSRGKSAVLHVAFQIQAHRNKTTGECRPSIPRLAFVTGLSERTVRRAVAELEHARLLKVTRYMGPKGGRSSDYELILTPDKSARGTPVKSDGGTPAKCDIEPLAEMAAGTRRVNPGDPPPLEAGGDRQEEDQPLTPEQREKNKRKIVELKKQWESRRNA
jgi:hypothetical protein